MIARTWHGIVPREMRDAFEKYGLISDPIVSIQEVTDDNNPFVRY